MFQIFDGENRPLTHPVLRRVLQICRLRQGEQRYEEVFGTPSTEPEQLLRSEQGASNLAALVHGYHAPAVFVG